MRNVKRIFIIYMVMIFSLLFISCGSYYEVGAVKASKEKDCDKLSVHYIGKGQSKCILVTQENESMIIYAGCEHDNSEADIEEYIKGKDVKDLKYIITQYSDENNIKSLNYIIEHFNVENLYCGNLENRFSDTDTLRELCIKSHINIIEPAEKYTLTLGESEISIFQSDIENNKSPVIMIKYKENKFLFMGDYNEEIQNKLLQEDIDLKADVIAISSNIPKAFYESRILDKSEPKYVVICSGGQKNFMHFDGRSSSDLNSKGIKTLNTNVNGTIIAVSNGENISFNIESMKWQDWVNDYSGESTRISRPPMKNDKVSPPDEKHMNPSQNENMLPPYNKGKPPVIRKNHQKPD